MSFDLCQVKKAEKPYYIESIGIHIYTIEELCFYLYENIYLIDQTIINEALCDWLRDELGLKKLYRQLYEQLEKQEGIAYFVLPIFREIGYLWGEELAFCTKFAPFVGTQNIEPLIAEIERAGAQIAQNGNPTIVFTHFALTVSKMIKHL